MGNNDQETGCNYLIPLSFEVNLTGLKTGVGTLLSARVKRQDRTNFCILTRYVRVFTCFMFHDLMITLSSHKSSLLSININQLPQRTSGLTRCKPHFKTLCTSELASNPLHAEFNKPQSHQHDFPSLRSRLPALPRHHFCDPRSPSTSTLRSQGYY